MKKLLYSGLLLSILNFACTRPGNTTSAVTPEPETDNRAAFASNDPPCDGGQGCDEIYLECPVPLDNLNEIDTFPDFAKDANKMLVSGQVFLPDGKTPAPGIVVYAYHTNQQGIYPKRNDGKPVGQWHGYLRGWVRTNANGEYRLYTCMPASYPNSSAPRHIHVHVKEPDKHDYYIDDIMFEDDKFISKSHRASLRNRGGSGLCNTAKEDGLLVCRRDIVLGKNIPGYPEDFVE